MWPQDAAGAAPVGSGWVTVVMSFGRHSAAPTPQAVSERSHRCATASGTASAGSGGEKW
jgi:hypothetical protein